MKQKYYKWLSDEIKKWMAKGIISQTQYEKIIALYNYDKENKKFLKISSVLLSFIAAIFIGAGLMLIFAHNWDKLTKLQKTVVVILPLLIAQIESVRGFLKKEMPAFWHEGVGSFYFISVGIAFAMIDQIYFLNFKISDLFLLWFLAALPSVYFFNALGPFILYLFGIIVWGISMYEDNAKFVYLQYWGLLALTIPFIVSEIKKGIYRLRFGFFSYALSASIISGIAFFVTDCFNGDSYLAWAVSFSILYLLGCLLNDKNSNTMRNAFHIFGVLGVFVIADILSFKYGFRETFSLEAYNIKWWKLLGYSILFVNVIVFLFLYLKIIKTKNVKRIATAFLPLLVVVDYYSWGMYEMPLALMFSLFLVVAGLVRIYEGTRNKDILSLNFGAVIILMVIFQRYFTAEYSYLIRGLFFIIMGLSIIGVNLYVYKIKRGRAQ